MIASRAAIWIGVARRVCTEIVTIERAEIRMAENAEMSFPVKKMRRLESVRTIESTKDRRLSRIFRKIPQNTKTRVGIKDNADQGESGYRILHRAMEKPNNKVTAKQLFKGRVIFSIPFLVSISGDSIDGVNLDPQKDARPGGLGQLFVTICFGTERPDGQQKLLKCGVAD